MALYRKEEKEYVRKLYKEGVKLNEICKRFEAEFGRATSTSMASKMGGCKRYTRRVPFQTSPASVMASQTPCFCSYCGSKLRR